MENKQHQTSKTNKYYSAACEFSNNALNGIHYGFVTTFNNIK